MSVGSCADLLDLITIGDQDLIAQLGAGRAHRAFASTGPVAR
jgi:hypothetical protein